MKTRALKRRYGRAATGPRGLMVPPPPESMPHLPELPRSVRPQSGTAWRQVLETAVETVRPSKTRGGA
jgi:hypothetical protein